MIYGIQKLWFDDIIVWCRVGRQGEETMDHVIARGCYEIEEHRDEVFDLPPNSTVFDVGGHIGTYSIMVKKRRPDISIFCFEPEPENFGMAVKNCITNDVDITVLQYAISHENGWFNLNGYEINSGAWCIIPRTLSSMQSFIIPVMGFTIESICDYLKLESPTFIKIDVEGAEHQIFPALSPRIMDNVLGFDADFHPFQPPKGYVKKTVDYLESNGFIVDWTNQTKSLVYKEKWW